MNTVHETHIGFEKSAYVRFFVPRLRFGKENSNESKRIQTANGL